MAKKMNRRDFIKTGLAGAGLMVGSTLLGGKWSRPAMAASGLPAHAAASSTPAVEPTATDGPDPIEINFSANNLNTLTKAVGSVSWSHLIITATHSVSGTPVSGLQIVLSLSFDAALNQDYVDNNFGLKTTGADGTVDFGPDNPSVTWTTGISAYQFKLVAEALDPTVAPTSQDYAYGL